MTKGIAFISQGVCAPLGFVASGMNCGIKRKDKDLALIYSKVPAVASGVFTANTFKAQPVKVSKKHLSDSKAQAIVANSGNANCFTGAYGLAYAENMAKYAAKELSIDKEDVLVASTGIIGKPLPIKNIKKSLPKLVGSLNNKGNLSCAKAILTTDTVTKYTAVRVKIGNSNVKIGVIAKGAGMISPNMSTMLCFITTDALIAPKLLKQALKIAVGGSFNNITIDGCMSTNDTVFVLANGLAKNPRISSKTSKHFKVFSNALTCVCLEMAKAIVKDAEGATKFIEINVDGAANDDLAKEVGLSIANSNLFKTAVYGQNPNWGRIIAAVGSLGLKIKEEDLKIKFSSFKKKHVMVNIHLDKGKGKSTIYTSDLSAGYVKINAAYN